MKVLDFLNKLTVVFILTVVTILGANAGLKYLNYSLNDEQFIYLGLMSALMHYYFVHKYWHTTFVKRIVFTLSLVFITSFIVRGINYLLKISDIEVNKVVLLSLGIFVFILLVKFFLLNEPKGDGYE